MLITAIIQLNDHEFEEKVFIPDCDINEYEGDPDAMEDFVSDCIYNPSAFLGKRIADRYLIEELIGSGGFAWVFRGKTDE